MARAIITLRDEGTPPERDGLTTGTVHEKGPIATGETGPAEAARVDTSSAVGAAGVATITLPATARLKAISRHAVINVTMIIRAMIFRNSCLQA